MNCNTFEEKLDLYLDGTLEESEIEELREHAAKCESCARALEAAELLMDATDDFTDGIPVPLPCQAAWQNAVRAEEKKNKRRVLYRAVSGIAAVCVITAGIAMFTGTRSIPAKDTGMSVFADSAEARSLVMSEESAPIESDYSEVIVRVSDTAESAGYLRDIMDEYGAQTDFEKSESGIMRFYLTLPDGSADLVSALDSIGTVTIPEQTGKNICITLKSK